MKVLLSDDLGHRRAADLPGASQEDAETWMDSLLVGIDPMSARFEVDHEFWNLLDLSDMAWRGVPIDVTDLSFRKMMN